jgi:lipopolysaccharide export system protein LptA
LYCQPSPAATPEGFARAALVGAVSWRARLQRVLSAALLVTISTPLGAALLGDSEQPIHIRADTAELDEREGTVVYRGDVRMTQGTVEVNADLVTIVLEDERVVRITAEGDRAMYRQQIGEQGEPVTALARTIVYRTQEEQVELIGNAHLSQRQNEFSGHLIRYDMRAGRVVAEGEEDEGVRMILQPPPRRE